ncbi:MAG: hypothetical protein JSU05_00240 [Bacteroidetes bacterium]|nr:hypothetical protein [Bacteroidota bacterium]
MAYDFDNLEKGKHTFAIRAMAIDKPALLFIILNGEKIKITISDKEYAEVNSEKFMLKKGMNQIKIIAQSNPVKIDWIKFN